MRREVDGCGLLPAESGGTTRLHLSKHRRLLLPHGQSTTSNRLKAQDRQYREILWSPQSLPHRDAFCIYRHWRRQTSRRTRDNRHPLLHLFTPQYASGPPITLVLRVADRKWRESRSASGKSCFYRKYRGEIANDRAIAERDQGAPRAEREDGCLASGVTRGLYQYDYAFTRRQV